ncbi:hypothetical protein H0X06_00835 [Candidatus Dependentiae bacterium]|nr:hypothetical protein [Candidatus Dependentiae bacterium]
MIIKKGGTFSRKCHLFQDPLSYLATTHYIKTLLKRMEQKDNKLIILQYEATTLGGLIMAMKKILGEVQ